MSFRSVSVALCTYNGSSYLEAQLNSIASQTVMPAELVIGDDCSSDSTLEIIRAFADRAPFPVLVHVNPQNRGTAQNFFDTMRKCAYDWIVLCDQDDVWLPNRIESLLQVIDDESNIDMVLSDGQLVGSDLRRQSKTLFQAFHLTRSQQNLINHGDAYRVLARHVFATGAGMMVRKSFVLSVPFPQADFLHDEWLAWFAGAGIRATKSKTFLYRQHANQQTGIDGRLLPQLKRVLKPQSKSIRSLKNAISRYMTLEASLSSIIKNEKDDQMKSIVAQKILFLKWRAGLPINRMKRMMVILAPHRLKQYGLYANGYRTILKDLLQQVPDRE